MIINNIKFNEKDEWGRPNKVTTPFFDQDNIEDYSLTMLSKAIDDCMKSIVPLPSKDSL